MSLDHLQDAKFSDICSGFSLKPIEDDGSYQAAIEILDRLFALDEPRTPAESEYFQMLAYFAYQYEHSNLQSGAFAALGHGESFDRACGGPAGSAAHASLQAAFFQRQGYRR
jgi:hypothetical protein